MSISDNIIISLLFLLIMVFIINKKTKIYPVMDSIAQLNNIPPVQLNNIPPVQLNNIPSVFQTSEVNLSPLQYTAGSVNPTVISSSIVNGSINIVPESNYTPNNFKSFNKKEISITNDILKPIGNLIADTIKNPPTPSVNEMEKPKKVISITKDIINPIVNLITNDDKQSLKSQSLPVYMSSNLTSSAAPVTEPQPNITSYTDNLFLLEPIELNNNILNFEKFNQDSNNISVTTQKVNISDSKNSIIRRNNLLITGFNDKNKDLVISGITQTNKI